MNLKDYIASGIIESYVMGLATEPEKAEFERMCAQHPELVAERRKFEESLEKYASEQAVRPPLEVKAKILKAIGEAESIPVSSSKSQRIITMENSKNSSSTGWLRFAAAAAVILLVGMVVLYYQVRQQNKDLANSNKVLAEKVSADEVVLNKIKEEQSVLKNRNATVINMVGTKIAPKSSASIYWDSTSTSVYLIVKNMPQLPTDRQYQLWALIDSQPKDLGVFDATDDNVILKMKNTQKAQAFAITIEKKGGVASPTLDSLQSMGKTQLSQ